MIKITIPGQPQGKGRARAFVRHGHVGHYTPAKTRSYEGVITTLAMEAMQGRAPSTKPIRMDMVCLFEVPQSWPQWKREAALRGEIVPTVKPDRDNVEKAVKDALNGVVWRDDCQIVCDTKDSRYSETPGVIVTVFEIRKSPAQIKRRDELNNNKPIDLT